MASAASRRLTAISVGVWPSSRTWPRGDLQRARVLVGQEDPQRRAVRSRRPPSFPHWLRPAYTGASTMLFAGRGRAPAATTHCAPAPRRSYHVRAPCLLRHTQPAVPPSAWPSPRDRGRGGEHEPGAPSTAPSRIARSSRATSTSATRSTARCSSSASCRSRASSRAATSAPRSPSTTSSRSRAWAWSRRSTASTSSARSRSRATRCRRSSARSSATSATARGRCASRATCRSSR